jgi:type VI secretion system protein ImpK
MGRADGFPAVWVAMFFLLFSLGLLIVLRIGLDKQTKNVVERVQPMMQPAADG